MQLPETFLTSQFIESAGRLRIRQRTAEAWLAKFSDESLVFQKDINKVMIDSNNNPLVKVFVYGIDFVPMGR